MALTYFKRFRMEIDLEASIAAPELPANYAWLPWDAAVLPYHADVKYRSFKSELDASVFPCLGDAEGCVRLMGDISRKEGFLPEATWLIGYRGDGQRFTEFCGTIQGIRDCTGLGAIQNVGVVPEHRGKGLGRQLLLQSLAGFQHAGLQRVYLEVTARNSGAIGLYERIGFRRARTLYKVVDVAYF